MYEHYVENCRRLGAEPMSSDDFQRRMTEWWKATSAVSSQRA